MSKEHKKRSIFTKFRNYFITGVVVLIPIGITVYLTLILITISSKILPMIKKEVDALSKHEDFHSMKMHHFFEHLCRLKQPIRIIYSTGNWLDIDSLEDLIRANNFI